MKRTYWGLFACAILVVAATACGNAGGDSEGTSALPSEPTTTDVTVPSETVPGDATYPERDTFIALPDVPGVTDTEIRYASLALKANNPLGTNIMDAFNEGIDAYFAWRNEEGGIYGRQLVLADKIDDEFGLNQAKALEIVGANNRFGVFVATLIFMGAAELNDAGIPTYVWNIHPNEMAGRNNLFGNAGTGCVGCTSRVVPYLAHLAGAKKVATVGYGVSENSKTCTQSQAKSIEKYSADLGLEVAYLNDNLAFGLPNGIGPEVTAMKDAGVKFIATCIDLNGMKTLAQELSRQGMDDVTLYHPNTYNQSFVAEAGGIFDGDYVIPGFAAFEYDSGSQLQQKFVEFMGKQGSTLSELAMVGWSDADLAFTGLLEAGPNFSRESVIAATNKLTAYSAGGLLNPIDWTRQHAAPTPDQLGSGYAQECFSAVQVKDGKFVGITVSGDPFLCWSNSTNDWSEPIPTSFNNG